LIDSIKGRL